MTLTKSRIFEDVAKLGFTYKRAQEISETLLEIVKRTLENGEDVLISRFGKFCVKHKRRRRGRNPATGEDLILAERRVVTFRPSSILRDKINRKE
ncbi:MAG: integration host factor subunit alpha [Deltaproteobacteria bacterium]|nr:integration host factor subunit alpha [Deltaproteobacteria bacterium]MBW2016445.1 integration host factor subunit alpha [Deltaproteobacteria bacterium]MBW2128607.1 integration host factor subunit alpha [Deltaproteobacteria bacterium]MBW2304499.1 integration host factor subunit alpha [Deltaproteobacteria bacterium]